MLAPALLALAPQNSPPNPSDYITDTTQTQTWRCSVKLDSKQTLVTSRAPTTPTVDSFVFLSAVCPTQEPRNEQAVTE